jgi:hypothetical protein
MKKLLYLFVLVFYFSLLSTAFGVAYQPDPNTILWGVGDDPNNQPDGELWYTFNDWTWVEGDLNLDSAWEGDPDTQPWPSTVEPATYCLKISAGEQVDGSTIEPTGYEFDIASAGITGKVISNVRIINSYWNFSNGVAPAFYDEDGNRVFCEDPATIPTWWQDVNIDFSDNPTKKIRFMIDPYASVWVWSGNFMYIEQFEITLIDEADAKCGTKYNPYPQGDLNGDCEVNQLDIAKLAEYWLECNDPQDSDCN